MSQKPQVVRIPLTNYLSLISFVKFLDMLGVLLISFLFFIFNKILFPTITFEYIEYITFFSLIAILINWYTRECRFTFIIGASPYLILLLISYFYL